MSYEDHIKKYPYCFRAFLESKEAQELIVFDHEEMFPESVIGSYQNWFMEKAGYNKMKEDYEKLLHTVEFYAEVNNWYKIIDQDGFKMIIASKDTEGNECVGGRRARQILKELELDYE